MKIKTVFALLIPLVLASCDRTSPDTVEGPRPVRMITVEDGAKHGIRYFPARLIAGDETQLAFKRGGQLQSLPVREGELVKKGQILAELDSKEVQLRLQDRNAVFELARAQYQRFATLAKQKVVAQAELDVRKAELDSTQAALKIAREDLADTKLYAPFDGIIASVNVRNYQVMAPGQLVATLNSLDTIDVVFSVPERLFTTLDMANRNYQPTVMLNHLSGREFKAQYKEHSASTSSTSQTFQVTLSMPRPADLPQLAGMSGRVRINTGKLSGSEQPAIIIPVEAVFSPDNKEQSATYVWVVKPEGKDLRVTERQVQVGQITALGIQVLSGLEDGEQIVAAGTSELQANQLVRPWVRERGL